MKSFFIYLYLYYYSNTQMSKSQVHLPTKFRCVFCRNPQWSGRAIRQKGGTVCGL